MKKEVTFIGAGISGETVFLDLTGKKLRDWDKEEKIDSINFNKKGDNTIF